MRTEDGRPRMMPAERAQNRAALPSPKGQTIVLPTDTKLKPEHSYRALFRADPRGYKAALFSETRNAYALAKLDSTVGIEAIYFRDKDELRSKNAAWDLRVEVNVEELDVNNATPVLQLTPKDPSVKFETLQKHYSGPYLPLKDIELELVAKKASAGSMAIGPHIALVQPKPTGPVTQYNLQQIVPMGFRGPFFDAERPAAPMVFVADDKLNADLGEMVATEFRAPDAGLEMGIIRASGQLDGQGDGCARPGDATQRPAGPRCQPWAHWPAAPRASQAPARMEPLAQPHAEAANSGSAQGTQSLPFRYQPRPSSDLGATPASA